MKKRILMVLLIAVLAAGAAFAAPEFKMSAGGGAFYAGDFGGGVSMSYKNNIYNYFYDDTLEMPNNVFGAYGFFDLTYAEISVGYFSGTMTWEETISTNIPGEPSGSYDFSISFSGINFGLFGKFPIAVSDKILFFPLVGIEYQVVNSAEASGLSISAAQDFSALWVKAGVGADFSLTDSIYLRLNALYGIRMESQREKDTADLIKAAFPDAAVETLLGHGLTAKLAVGFKF